MAIANLHETLLTYTLRKNALAAEIMEYQSQKTLALANQGDLQSLKFSRENEIKDYYKSLYNDDEELQENYIDYTEIPEFEEEMDKIAAEFQNQINELTAWETALDNQITTASAEQEEINAYIESLQTMLSSNIQEDFNYGLNQ